MGKINKKKQKWSHDVVGLDLFWDQCQFQKLFVRKGFITFKQFVFAFSWQKEIGKNVGEIDYYWVQLINCNRSLTLKQDSIQQNFALALFAILVVKLECFKTHENDCVFYEMAKLNIKNGKNFGLMSKNILVGYIFETATRMVFVFELVIGDQKSCLFFQCLSFSLFNIPQECYISADKRHYHLHIYLTLSLSFLLSHCYTF